MLNQFSRTALLLGQVALNKLKTSKVAVFGIGGVGAYTAEALARSGVYNLTLIDDDLICLTNINRQLIATCKTVGKSKTDIMRRRILEINPRATVISHECFYNRQTASDFNLGEYDYVVDAIDTISSKLDLIQSAQDTKTRIISCMGVGNKLNPLDLKVADIYETSVCPVSRVMRHELKKRYIKELKVVYSKEKPIKPIQDESNSCKNNCVCHQDTKRTCSIRREIPGSVAFVPSVAGLVLASEVIKDLTQIV